MRARTDWDKHLQTCSFCRDVLAFDEKLVAAEEEKAAVDEENDDDDGDDEEQEADVPVTDDEQEADVTDAAVIRTRRSRRLSEYKKGWVKMADDDQNGSLLASFEWTF